MSDNLIGLRSERFSLADKNEYLLFGIWPNQAKCEVVLGNGMLEHHIEEKAYFSAAERFDLYNNDRLKEVCIHVKIPESLPDSGRFTVYYTENGRKEWYSCPVSSLKSKNRLVQYFIQQTWTDADEVKVNGWIASPGEVECTVRSEKGELMEAHFGRFNRADVQAAFPEEKIESKCGFLLSVKRGRAKKVLVTFHNSLGEAVFELPLTRMGQSIGKLGTNFGKARAFVKRNGIFALPGKVLKSGSKKHRPVMYEEWRRHNMPSEEELNRQRGERFDVSPLISIVVPLYKTPEKYLEALVDSVKQQTYPNWQLCLSDGSGDPSPIKESLERLAASDRRIKVLPAKERMRIVQNTNHAIENADGEFVAFADHDDLLAPDALYECVKVINEHADADFIYTDEDKVDGSGRIFTEPHMKPDLNIDLLRTVNYISHLSVVRRSLLDRVGYLDAGYEGAQDHELTFRIIENTSGVYHIPKVLYHWRTHSGSTSEDPESKKYAFIAGAKAVQDHLNRLGIKAEVTQGERWGLYRTKYLRDRDPLVSIIIPNKDHIDDLERCIDSIERLSDYRNYEFVIVENNSTSDETFKYYKELEARNEKARVIYYDGSFNYSKINNFGAAAAKGEYFLLLNNDTQIINPGCIEEMLSICMREDVGAVGARLYFEDNTIQHAGVVIGFGEIAGHCFIGFPRDNTGYFHRIICTQDYSAVTAACMMVDRKVFEEVGGLSEELAVAFNDIDFCMKIREKGYLIVYAPYAELYHFESKSRGLEDTPEKIARFKSEIETFKRKWPRILHDGDPFYSPNLTRDRSDFALKRNF